MSNIKVLGLFEPGFIPRGGAEIHVIELFSLLKDFVDFEIISVDSDYKELIDYLDKLEIDYFFYKNKIVYFYREIKINIFIANSSEELINTLVNFINKNKPDIFYSFFIRELCYRIFIKFSNIPVILFAHSKIIKPWTIDDNNILKYILNQNNIYASSNFIKDYFIKIWKKKILVFIEFINKNNYLSENKEEKYITFFNPCKEKGVEIFYDIANTLKNKSFFVIGSWEINNNYNQIISSLKDLNNITINQPSLDMKKIYEQTKILIMPSLIEEGFGRIIIEAGMNKIPVIASNKGAITEVLNDKGLIIDIDKNNIYDWINGINNIEENYLEFSKKSYINYKDYENKLNIEIESFKKFILSLLKKN